MGRKWAVPVCRSKSIPYHGRNSYAANITNTHGDNRSPPSFSFLPGRDIAHISGTQNEGNITIIVK